MKKLLIAFITLISLSCAQTDTDKIGEAQLCLDKATTATASTCMDKVTGIESAGAYNIRCSALYVQEGFSSGTKITNAFNAISSGTGASNMQSFLGILGFTSQSTIPLNYNNAANAYSYCYKSGSKGALMLSVYSYFFNALINYLYAYDSGTTCNSYNLTTCFSSVATAGAGAGATYIANMIDSNTSNTAAKNLQSSIGAAFRAMYTLTCTGSTTNQSICSTLKTSVDASGGSDRTLFVNIFSNICTTPGDGNCT